MPTYDYVCHNCSKVREVVKTMQDYGEPVPCPKCGTRMMRFWSRKAPRALYKGNGWTGAQKRGS